MRTDGKVLGSHLFHYVCHSFSDLSAADFVSDVPSIVFDITIRTDRPSGFVCQDKQQRV